MKRVLASVAILLAVGAFVFLSTGAKGTNSRATSYNIELGNAFGLVIDAPLKVSGIPAGKITGITLDQKTLNAVIHVDVTTASTPAFHTSATCNSQPQSLIGEYFVSCVPGNKGKVLKTGATIPVSHTSSTIPADLLLDINQVPEQERLALIINSLGAGVAGRESDIQSALDKAIPALSETDDLLNLLARDSHTIQSLTVHADTVVTALADNTNTVKRFIEYADRSAQYTAAQHVNLQTTLKELPGFLAQLRPAMAKLGDVATTNTPVAENLRAAAGELDRLFVELPGFANSSLPALRALGRASVTGRTAVKAATPIVAQLNQFSKNTPDLAKNLSIVLPYMNSQKHATEKNSRSPGGKGYSGLQALIEFTYHLASATSYYGSTGHELAVDAFTSSQCSPYATPTTITMNLASNAAATRACYAFLGPNQPGVTTKDPTNPYETCLPDPGGAPPGDKGATSDDNLPKCTVAEAEAEAKAEGELGTAAPSSATRSRDASKDSTATRAGPSAAQATKQLGQTVHALGKTLSQVIGLIGRSPSSTTSTTSTTSTSTTSTTAVSSTVAKTTKSLGLGVASSRAATAHGSATRSRHARSSTSSSDGSSSSGSAQRLLNYLLAP